MFYKIGDFARKLGVSTGTLRNWERTGILKPHHISPTGYRYYSDAQIKDLTTQEQEEKVEAVN